MEQEYIAFIIFIAALVFTVFSLGKYMIRFKKNRHGSHCKGGNCACENKRRKGHGHHHHRNRAMEYKHVRLK